MSLHCVLFFPLSLFSGPLWGGSAALVAGIAAAVFLAARDFRRRPQPPTRSELLVFSDVASPALVFGYATARLVQWAAEVPSGRWAMILAGLEILLALSIVRYLWLEGRRAIQLQRPTGLVTAEGLILAGVGFLGLEFLKSRLAATTAIPQSAVTLSVAAVIAGAALVAVRVRQFLAEKEEHRILRHIDTHGEATQSEYTPASAECPHPERWKMFDTMTAEVEVLEFLKCLVMTMKPELIVETGTFTGISTIWMAEGLRENGRGRIITCEYDPKVFAKAKERMDASGLKDWIEYRNESSLETSIPESIDLLFSDSDPEIRSQEVRRFLPKMNPYGLILIHDAGSHYKVVREAARKLEQEGLISVVLLPTPRGLVMAQKREGRR